MRVASLSVLFVVLATSAGWSGEDVFGSPPIADYGRVVAIPDAAEPPRRGAKVVFDITAGSNPEQVNPGLESVARYINLHAQAGHGPKEVELALVLHGAATHCALDDAAFSRELYPKVVDELS